MSAGDVAPTQCSRPDNTCIVHQCLGVHMKLRTIAVAAVAVALFGASALPSDYVNEDKRFSLALPDGWHLTEDLPTEVLFNWTGHEDLGAAVEVLPAGTQLTDPQVVGRIDLSDRNVTRTIKRRQAGFPALRIEGTARSEGQDLLFYAIAIAPRSGPTIELDVWVPPGEAKDRETHAVIEKLLAGLKPLK